jgi:predicted acetyltransferase
MSLTMTWHGKESAELVGKIRAQCYADTSGEVGVFQERLANDPRISSDDLLIAQRDGLAVGTATSYSMTMWARGQAFPCQGVAYVGTIKTQRRSGGIASRIMAESLRKARQRGQVLSALMPFRASFYEHFGYGLVERRTNWTIPLSVMPEGAAGGFEFIEGADEARLACRQRMVQAGQCEIERTPGMWSHWTSQEGEAQVIGERAPDGTMPSWFSWHLEKQNDKDILKVDDLAFDSIDALKRALRFFGTLRDQYWGVRLTLPADLQLNRLLKEPQVPHRLVKHEAAKVETVTRMQVRVLDHARLIGGLHLSGHLRGSLNVAIAECEGETQTLKINLEDGRATAQKTSTAPDIEIADRHWAAIVLGDLPATQAANLNLIKVHRPAAVPLLDAFAAGPAPFCNEYF